MAAAMRFFALRLCTLVHGRFLARQREQQTRKMSGFYLPSHTELEIHFNTRPERKADEWEKMNLSLKNLKLLPFSFLCEDSDVSSPVWDYFIVQQHKINAGFPVFLNRFSSSRIPTHHLSGGKRAASRPSRAEPSRAQPLRSPPLQDDCPPFTSDRAINTEHNFILSLSQRSISLRGPSTADGRILQTDPGGRVGSRADFLVLCVCRQTNHGDGCDVLQACSQNMDWMMDGERGGGDEPSVVSGGLVSRSVSAQMMMWVLGKTRRQRLWSRRLKQEGSANKPEKHHFVVVQNI